MLVKNVEKKDSKTASFQALRLSASTLMAARMDWGFAL